MRTVLIFAHECAPYNRSQSTIGAQRPAQFAKHLPKHGWRAIVICRDAALERAATSACFDEVRSAVRDRLAAARSDESVIIPTPSLTHDGALDRLWHWTNRATKARQAWLRPVRQGLTMFKFLTGDYSQSWQPCARVAADELAGNVKVDCCIGEHGPDAGLFLARSFAWRNRIPWVVDFRDPAVLQHGALARCVRLPILRRQMRTADSLINVTPAWSELDRAEFLRPCVCIPNGFDPEEFPPASRAPEPCVTVSYAGNINAGVVDPLRGLEVFLDALVSLNPGGNGQATRPVRFHYFGQGSELVARMARDRGVGDWVFAEPQMERRLALRELTTADMLLLISVGRPEAEDRYYRSGFYPGKVFEYFGARRPILCVPGDGGQLDALIRETRTGIILRTPREVGDYLRQTSALRSRGEKLPYAPDGTAVAQYTRGNLAGRLAGCLEECLEETKRQRD